MTSDHRDYRSFLPSLVGLVITGGALLSLNASDPGLLTGARIVVGTVGAVLTILAFRFAMRRNWPPAERPSSDAPVTTPASNGQTWGTGTVGSDMAVDTTFIGGGPGVGVADLNASADIGGSSEPGGGDAGGGDAGSGDSGGGGASGGGSGS